MQSTINRGRFMQADPKSAQALLVTPDNFTRAESDNYLSNIALRQGGFGKFSHQPNLMPVDAQTVIRPNRDTLYSAAVCDLDAGPIAVTLPDPDGRFMSMVAIDEDQYVIGVAYRPGTYCYRKADVGTRYILIGVRILVDPRDPQDLQRVHALQAALRIDQRSPGRFEIPVWDQASQRKVREALLTLASTLPDSRGMFGYRGQVDPIRHLIGTAYGWGGNPETDAFYINVTPSRNDGSTVYRMEIGDVPVDGFWSVSVYNARGYFEPNRFASYSVNSVTAERDASGAVVVQFGGCDGKTPNCIATMPGWNYMVRLYRPRGSVLRGTWTFPEAVPVG